MALTPPSITVILDDDVVATMETYATSRMAVTSAEATLLLGALFNKGQVPGIPQDRVPLSVMPSNGMQKVDARELRIHYTPEESSNTEAFRDAQTLSTNIDDVGTAGRAIYAYYTDYAGIPWTRWKENQSPQAVLNLWQEMVDMVTRSITNRMEVDLFSTNTDTAAGTQDSVMGLQHLVDETQTATVWGLSRSDFAFHNNSVVDAGADTFANVGLTKMDESMVVASGTNGLDRPNIIITEPVLHRAYAVAARAKFETNAPRTAELGFDVQFFQGRPIVYSALAPIQEMRFLNMRYARLFQPTGPDFEVFNFDPSPDQLLVFQRRIVSGLQWGFTRYDRQLVLHSFTDT